MQKVTKLCAVLAGLGLLFACAPVMEEPVFVDPEPIMAEPTVEARADEVCEGAESDDGIGGTGCEPAID